MKRGLILLALAWSPVRAEFYSGNELLQRMQADSHVERAVALGFVAGVADAWEYILFCPPDSVTIGQVRDISMKFLILNPGQRHKSAAGLVSDALAEVWPCARKPGKGGSKL